MFKNTDFYKAACRVFQRARNAVADFGAAVKKFCEPGTAMQPIPVYVKRRPVFDPAVNGINGRDLEL